MLCAARQSKPEQAQTRPVLAEKRCSCPPPLPPNPALPARMAAQRGALEQLRFNEYDRGDLRPDAYDEFLTHWRASPTSPPVHALSVTPPCAPHDVCLAVPSSAALPCRGRHELAAMVNRPEHVVKMLMQPGDCLVVNNHRVLHGRQEFFNAAGAEREMIGCYLSRDALESRLRSLGLQDMHG